MKMETPSGHSMFPFGMYVFSQLYVTAPSVIATREQVKKEVEAAKQEVKQEVQSVRKETSDSRTLLQIQILDLSQDQITDQNLF